MSEVIATRRSIPELTPEQVARLPRRRNYGLRQFVALLAAIATFAALIAVDAVFAERDLSEPRGSALHFGAMVLPWLLVLPWLRSVDIRPVPWFFGCLAIGWIWAPMLVGRFVGRVLALPYRDWLGDYWHASRARLVPGSREWIVVPAAEAGPYHRPPAERWLRAGWVLVVATTIPVLILDAREVSWPGRIWLACLVTMMLASTASFRLDRRRLRQVIAASDQADDR